MTALQWALLVLAFLAVGVIWWLSRPRPERIERQSRVPPSSDQLDLWGKPASGGGTEAFDEFGVSEPRTRGGNRVSPAVEAPDAQAPSAETPEKIIVFYIFEHEGTYILGPQLHETLRRQGLSFGDRRIYHRTHDGRTVFSVASLLKPGELDPEQAEGFSTPGLSVFMVLPCGCDPAAAFDDMLSTAQALASGLNAQLLDADRKLLDEERAAELRFEVGQWAQAGAVTGSPAA